MKNLIEKQGTLWTDPRTLLVYIDVETGGFSVDQNALLSISICLPSVNRRFEPDDWFLLPTASRWVHSHARAVNGFSPEAWRRRGALEREIVLDRFVKRLEEIRRAYKARHIAFCAHNASFDRRFLLHNLQETGWDADESSWDWDWYCTKRTCQAHRSRIAGLCSFGLTSCCQAFRIRERQMQFHEAREDVMLGSELVLELAGRGIGLVEG